MTANITAFIAFQGLATCLDTMCAQAYGAGEKRLVGLYCQRMMVLFLGMWILIAVLWFFSEPIMIKLVPDPDTARLCALYLRFMIFAVPGYAAFEAGKRFLQAQGLFRATTYILLLGTPVNIALMWLLIWKCELGFVGAPISIAITRTLLFSLLVLYVMLVDGSQCWGGFSRGAFDNIGGMAKLAVPGMIMMEAEYLAFEILTLLSARFGVEYLAAQSVIISVATLMCQISFSISIAASTRVASLIGAGKVELAKLAARVVSYTPGRTLYIQLADRICYSRLSSCAAVLH